MCHPTTPPPDTPGDAAVRADLSGVAGLTPGTLSRILNELHAQSVNRGGRTRGRPDVERAAEGLGEQPGPGKQFHFPPNFDPRTCRREREYRHRAKHRAPRAGAPHHGATHHQHARARALSRMMIGGHIPLATTAKHSVVSAPPWHECDASSGVCARALCATRCVRVARRCACARFAPPSQPLLTPTQARNQASRNTVRRPEARAPGSRPPGPPSPRRLTSPRTASSRHALSCMRLTTVPRSSRRRSRGGAGGGKCKCLFVMSTAVCTCK